MNYTRNFLSLHTICGEHNNVPYYTNVEISLLFTYKGVVADDWTKTNCEAVPEIDSLVEREDMSIKKKKTIFDILDFD